MFLIKMSSISSEKRNMMSSHEGGTERKRERGREGGRERERESDTEKKAETDSETKRDSMRDKEIDRKRDRQRERDALVCKPHLEAGEEPLTLSSASNTSLAAALYPSWLLAK